jgi:hypothetical protein
MRLLRNNDYGHFSLVEYTGQDIPPYAILSHTWGPDHLEVTFSDITNNTGRDKDGYRKIRFCGDQAAKDGLQYFWVDTCCIDKSSSAELTESINSMFQWYERAAVCYVVLEDLASKRVLARYFPQCRWFKRGWTLQELIAPEHVRFYDCTWTYLGSKETLADLISATTGIPKEYLVQGMLASASVALKMSWAARRETKRIEDRAYSLLGIFDVNIPLIYGEGMKAFRRLQEEIIKRSNDLTIFAWETQADTRQELVSPLATSPNDFAGSHDINQYTADFAEFSMTNKGLLLSSDIPLRSAFSRAWDFSRISQYAGIYGGVNAYLVYLGTSKRTIAGIYLTKIGPNLFCRNGHLARVNFEDALSDARTYEVNETYVLLNTMAALDTARTYRIQGIHVPEDGCFRCKHTYPQALWDEADRVFLRPKRYVWANFPMVLIMIFDMALNEGVVTLAVLCHHLSYGPVLKIFSQNQYPQEFEVISQARYKQEGIHVQELDLQARSTRAMTDTTMVKMGGIYLRVSVSLQPQSIQTFVGPVQVSTLRFNVQVSNT